MKCDNVPSKNLDKCNLAKFTRLDIGHHRDINAGQLVTICESTTPQQGSL